MIARIPKDRKLKRHIQWQKEATLPSRERRMKVASTTSVFRLRIKIPVEGFVDHATDKETLEYRDSRDISSIRIRVVIAGQEACQR